MKTRDSPFVKIRAIRVFRPVSSTSAIRVYSRAFAVASSFCLDSTGCYIVTEFAVRKPIEGYRRLMKPIEGIKIGLFRPAPASIAHEIHPQAFSRREIRLLPDSF